MLRRWRVTAISVVVAVLIPSTALASRRFPAQVATELGLSYVPACSLCHMKGNTGPGTAETPVALSMKARGLQSGGRASVSSALAALGNDRVDSDGDGITDVDELRMGTDPNSPESTSLAGRADPSFGCSVGGGQGRGERGGFLAFLAPLALSMRRRRTSHR